MAPAPVLRGHRPLNKPPKIRYFKGKAPDAAVSSDEDDSDGEVAPPEPVQIDKTLVAGGAGRILKEPSMKVALRDVKVEGGRVLFGGKLGVVKQGEPNLYQGHGDELICSRRRRGLGGGRHGGRA